MLTCNRQTQRDHPPLDYPDNYFGLIYALSVFTHLTIDLQHAWMTECYRLLRPGGILLFTTHGDYHLPFIPDTAVNDYRSGRPVVLDGEFVGQNVCTAFHPFAYVQKELLRDFTLLQFYPRAGRGVPWQDIYLVQKPLTPA